MFDSLLVLMDDLARPVLIIPESLPKGDAFLNIVDGGLDIGVGEKTYGQIRDMENEMLIMLSLQDEIGISTYKGEEKEQMPDTIQYVATVRDMRS